MPVPLPDPEFMTAALTAILLWSLASWVLALAIAAAVSVPFLVLRGLAALLKRLLA